MSFKSWWHRLIHGKWDQNRLTSRKFLLTLLFFCGGLGFTYVIAGPLGIQSSTVVETGINAVRDVMIAWLSVQGVVDMIRRSGPPQV